jgi:hypothetical protein
VSPQSKHKFIAKANTIDLLVRGTHGAHAKGTAYEASLNSVFIRKV